MLAPCKNCKDRKTGRESCHAHCEKYKEFKEEVEERNHKIKLEKEIGTHIGYERFLRKRRRARKGNKNR